MSYIEKRPGKEKVSLYFVKKVSFMNKQLAIRKYIGKPSSLLTKEKFLLDNLKKISDEEFKFKLKFLKSISAKISHSKNLPERVEKKSIKINNLLDGKNCKDEVGTEFAKEFIFNSNNIEGSKIPPERVREIIEAGDTKYPERNEVREVKNSISAYKYLGASFKFNLNSIKKLYHLLTQDLIREGNHKYPRGFKKEQNIVGNSQTSKPENVEQDLQDLLNWYKKNKRKIHPLILAFQFHQRYESIHPFLDGNGRTGRMIMNKILMSSGYPPIIVYKSNKISYFNALEKASQGRDKKYFQFMLDQADKSYSYILDIIERY